MTVLDQFVRTPIAEALGSALAHSVWQGAAAALAVAVVLRSTRNAQLRYAAGCAALALMLIAFAVTVARSFPHGAAGIAGPAPAELRRASDAAGALSQPARDLSALLPWLAPFWIAGVLVFHARALAGWIASRRLRRAGVCAVPDAWKARLDALKSQLRVASPVVLLESSLARVPAVAGVFRPVILLPVGLLAGMPPEFVESVLLHELAHIRRRDYLVNLVQTWAEAIFFYHPAGWWISRVIRSEREHCCDDLAVSVQGDPHRYATALAAMERYRWDAEPALAATGGNLVIRIRRLLSAPEGPRPGFGPLLSAAVLALSTAAALLAWQSRPAAQEAAPVTPYMKWVNEDVIYIIDDRERARFLELGSDEERENFIEQFWQRRDPTPGTPANEFKEEHYRRISYANQRFADAKSPGWKTERGRIYIVYGPADEIESHPQGNWKDAAPASESWLYRRFPNAPSAVVFKFSEGSPAIKMFLIRK